MKKLFIILVFIIFNISIADIRILKPGVTGKTSFAIFIDSLTFKKVSQSVIEYKNSIEKENLPTYILIDNWRSPDEIKKHIIELYNSKPKLEGAVFIGDIPIPMIREAQHLTSAFKLDEQRFPHDRSSVPSDRFYDDLDLKFEFINQDTVKKLYFYYRLLADSPQKIEKEIYTARIKPSPDSLKYEKIEKYLFKISKLKNQKEVLNNVLVFTGHGYHSEALTAWSDETLIISEQFPDAFRAGGRFKKYFYEMNREMKKVILSELEKPEIDLAIFHAHGTYDAQLLSGYGKVKNVNENIESIKFYLRSKLRAAKETGRSVDETIRYFKDTFGIPDNWFIGAFDPDIIKKDSLLNYNLDIHIEDIRKISPQAKLVIFDECFNGSFHLDEYVAGEYVFGNGRVIAGIANTVNVLQDLFVNEMAGLLRLGFSIGEWHKNNNYLESHLIGDPTFKFSTRFEENFVYDLKYGTEKKLVNFLKSNDPVVRSFTINSLFKLKREKFSDELKSIYLSDSSPDVRLIALKCLAELRDRNFEAVILKSINDPHELIRRFSVIWMGLIGKLEFIPLIVRAAFDDESDRVRYNAKSILELMNSDESIKIIKDEYEKIFLEKLKYGFDTSNFYFRIPDKRRQNEILEVVLNDTINLKKKIFEIKTFRKYIYQDAVSDLLALLQDFSKPIDLRITVAEILGWYNFSPQRFRIIKECESILNSSNFEKFIQEVKKTINRLKTGPNNPLTP